MIKQSQTSQERLCKNNWSIEQFLFQCVFFLLCLVTILPIDSAYGQETTSINSTTLTQPAEEFTPEQNALVAWVMNEQKRLSLDTAQKIVRTIYRYAAERNLDPMSIVSVMRLESRFNPNAKSNHGALGLMQVLVRKHRDKLKGRSPYSIEASIEVGTKILSDCFDKSKGSLYGALNCYSGGGGKKYMKYYADANHKGEHFVIEQLFADGPGKPEDPVLLAAK